MGNITMETVQGQLDKLIGCKEFKALTDMFPRFAEHIPDWCLEILFTRTYLFSINDGDGLSTQLELLSQIIGVIDEDTPGKISRYKLEVPEDAETCANNKMTRRDRMLELLNASDLLDVNEFADALEIVCIDITDWIEDTESQEFRVAISRLRETMVGRIIVYRVPVVDQATLDRIAESINSYMNVKVICTPPFSIQDYMLHARRVAAEYDLDMDEAAFEAFEKMLVMRRNMPDFWGFRTVEAMINDCMFETLKGNFGFHEEDLEFSEIGG